MAFLLRRGTEHVLGVVLKRRVSLLLRLGGTLVVARGSNRAGVLQLLVLALSAILVLCLSDFCSCSREANRGGGSLIFRLRISPTSLMDGVTMET